MADVTIIPPSQVAAVAGGGQQAGAGTPTSSLSQGTLVSGTIAGKDVNGNYLLKSPQGTFTLQSATPLTYNSDVTIRIGANTAGATSARIVSVNGESFSDFSAPQVEDSDSVSSTLLAQAPVAPDGEAPSTPQALQAVVTSAPVPAASGAQGSAASPLVTGNTVVVRVAPDASGAETSPNASQAATSQTSSPAAAAAVVSQPQQIAQNPQTALVQQQPSPATPPQPAASTLAVPLSSAAAPVETELAAAQVVTQAAGPQAVQDQPSQPSSTQTAQLQTSEPQATQAQTSEAQASNAPAAAQYGIYSKQSAPPAPALPAGSPAPASTAAVPAQVVSTDENGTIALQTAQGGVSVKATGLSGLSAFAPGTNVTVEVLTNIATQALAEAPAGVSELASSWQSLKDILAVVNAAAPAAANALIGRLPQLDSSFASGSTAFITAIIQGDARKLLGDDTVDALRNNGRGDLVDKFSAELSTLSSSFTTPAQRQMPGWQMLFLPFVYQEAVQQARIYVKRNPQKKERASARDTADTRFVVEVDLSELGGVQMDGLVRKKEKATAFDLVIRSHMPFSQEARSEIQGIYNSAAQITGFKGSLAFQVTHDFPVKPLEEAADAARSITV